MLCVITSILFVPIAHTLKYSGEPIDVYHPDVRQGPMWVTELVLSLRCLPDTVGECRRGNRGLDRNIRLRYYLFSMLFNITRRPDEFALQQS